MNTAQRLMAAYNSNALISEEDGCALMIEDVTDTDGRMYRVEYRATEDGQRAVAFCLYNPWGDEGCPAADTEYTVGHVASDGFLCLGEMSVRSLDDSPYDLDYTVRRARYWCAAFSALRETGEFPEV